MRRPNLKVLTHALATRIVFEGRRAVGLEYSHGGATHRVRVECARSFLRRADQFAAAAEAVRRGAGRRIARARHPVVHDLPGVGENLQDHLEFYFQVACKEPITLYSSINLWSRALIGARWLLRKDGLGATNHFETCGFIRSRAGIRLSGHPVSLPAHGGGLRRLDAGAGARLPGARRAHALEEPRLGAAGLDQSLRQAAHLVQLPEPPDDWTEMRACVRLTREIFAQPAFDRYRGREIQPGATCRPTSRSMPSFAPRSRAPITRRAPARWAARDPMAVVTRDTRSMDSRVCGWWIPPSCPRSPRAISTRPPSCWRRRPRTTSSARLLAPEDAPFYQASNWQSAQR
jgi:choline dehydrogenase